MRQTQFKNVDPPMWVAWNQAFAGIRVRMARQLVTMAGISLGIAFFTSVQVVRVAEQGESADSADRLKWLAATSLVMCLVGITNSMLMSVAERFREIGTIKCLGASDSFVVKVFLMEATLLGIVGSCLGAVGGAGLMTLGEMIQHHPVALPAEGGVVLAGVAVGTAMTILAAVVPAIQAAKMPAAAALRVEI